MQRPIPVPGGKGASRAVQAPSRPPHSRASLLLPSASVLGDAALWAVVGRAILRRRDRCPRSARTCLGLVSRRHSGSCDAGTRAPDGRVSPNSRERRAGRGRDCARGRLGARFGVFNLFQPERKTSPEEDSAGSTGVRAQ